MICPICGKKLSLLADCIYGFSNALLKGSLRKECKYCGYVLYLDEHKYTIKKEQIMKRTPDYMLDPPEDDPYDDLTDEEMLEYVNKNEENLRDAAEAHYDSMREWA